jgi:hypothetical protein
MIEWLALALIVPLILVPLVLLYGFAGCDLIFPLRDAPAVGKSFEANLTEVRNRANRTIIQRIEPVRLSNSGSSVRIVIQRPSTGDLLITGMYISQPADAGGDPYDSGADLTPVFETPLGLTADPANGLLELDIIAYEFDHTRPVLISFDVGNSGSMPRGNALAAEATAFFGPVQDPALKEAAILDRQPGYESESRIYLIQRIDVG